MDPRVAGIGSQATDNPSQFGKKFRTHDGHHMC